MKRIIFFFIIIVSIVNFSFAQSRNGYKNALGIRITEGAEISFQNYLSRNGRLEVSMGVNKYGFNTGATYQFMFNLPISTSGTWQWYVGPGANVGAYNSNSYGLAAVGQIGAEYTFVKIPLLLSVDYRSCFYFIPEAHFYFGWPAISVRYCF